MRPACEDPCAKARACASRGGLHEAGRPLRAGGEFACEACARTQVEAEAIPCRTGERVARASRTGSRGIFGTAALLDRDGSQRRNGKREGRRGEERRRGGREDRCADDRAFGARGVVTLGERSWTPFRKPTARATGIPAKKSGRAPAKVRWPLG
jgi:hypothetical protein